MKKEEDRSQEEEQVIVINFQVLIFVLTGSVRSLLTGEVEK